MYINCSYTIKNCISCESNHKCLLCEPGYIILNDHLTHCHYKSNINLSYYFTENNLTYYSCNDYKYKNNIQCFIIIPGQQINLTFIQTQLIDNYLIVYMLTHSPLPQNLSLIITINLYSKNIRNLQFSEEKEVTLKLSNDSNGSKNKIVSFISNEKINNDSNEEKNVKIKDIKFNEEDYISKTIIDNNICSIKFDKNSKLIDTGNVKSLIKENKIYDCSKINENNIIVLNLDKINGCEFYLNSNDVISISGGKLDIELVEYENNINKINAKCDIKGDNINNIKCNIKEDIDNKYILKDNLLLFSDKYIYISTDNDNTFQILCKNQNNKNNNYMTIIIIICIFIIISVIIITICICKFKKKDNRNNNVDKNRYGYRPGMGSMDDNLSFDSKK